jgi:DNA-binding NarL/FixJ family response regulator
LVADGLTSSQIAARLQVSEKAVEAAITRLNKVLNIDKLGQKNLRIHLVKAYYELIGKTKSND